MANTYPVMAARVPQKLINIEQHLMTIFRTQKKWKIESGSNCKKQLCAEAVNGTNHSLRSQ